MEKNGMKAVFEMKEERVLNRTEASRKSLESARAELCKIRKNPNSTQSDISFYDATAMINMFTDHIEAGRDPLSAMYECIDYIYSLGFRRGRKYGMRQTQKKEVKS
jgi:hypothetical protein